MPAPGNSSNGGAPSRRFAPAAETRAEANAGPRADTIEGLTLALGKMRRGAAALKAENHELRAEVAGLQLTAPERGGGDRPAAGLGQLAEIALPTGSGAPGAARMVVAHCLAGLVATRILRDAELLVSELVTNSLEHGELGAGDTLLVRVYLAASTLRLEIENPGTAGVVASRPLARKPRRGGFGLELVDLLAARWGVSRGQATNVWFEMARA
jgi:anti-sigma regulatory factor (Ser/Thr protein kinase)